jgi:DNA-binding NtrC family response regulator
MLDKQSAATPGFVRAALEPATLIPAEGLDLEEHLAQIRRAFMLEALEEAGGVQKKAAARLGMSFRSFRYYLDKLEARPETGERADAEDSVGSDRDAGADDAATDDAGDAQVSDA